MRINFEQKKDDNFCDVVQVNFPDSKTGGMNLFAFATFYSRKQNENDEVNTLHITCEDLYELGAFASELQKTTFLSLAREAMPLEESKDEVPTPETNQQ